MDGTLVESEPIWAEAKHHVSKSHGVDVSDATLAAYVGRSVADFVQEILGHVDASTLESRITERAVSKYDNDLAEISGAANLVRAFHTNGFAVAICSSASLLAIQKCLAFLGVQGCVSVIVSAATLPKGKPDKLPYQETLRRLGLAPNQAIVFEDALAGITSSVGAGIKTIWVGDSIDPKDPDCVMFAQNIGDIAVI